jgi:hypothetical protein
MTRLFLTAAVQTVDQYFIKTSDKNNLYLFQQEQ